MTHAARSSWLLVLIAVAGFSPVQAQAYENPADVATIDAIMLAYYEVVSGPAGEAADRARDIYLHQPSALIGIPGRNDAGERVLNMITLAQYHDAFGGPRGEPFYEYEIHREVQRFGRVAHVWSTYASSREPDGEPYARGINSIELYWDGSRWWITSWSFDQERPELQIPGEYLH
ncbi:MAG: hypothetical protein V3T16_11695 [Gemmatimonadales bacterium]